MEANAKHSLAHSTWNCKYHIVFAPKYRRKIFYGEHKAEIGQILRELCNWKQVHIVEAEVCPDHIHMLVEIPPKESVAGFIGFLSGYGGKECEEDCGVHPKSTEGRPTARPVDDERF